MNREDIEKLSPDDKDLIQAKEEVKRIMELVDKYMRQKRYTDIHAVLVEYPRNDYQFMSFKQIVLHQNELQVAIQKMIGVRQIGNSNSQMFNELVEYAVKLVN